MVARPSGWTIRVEVPHAAASLLVDALDSHAAATSAFLDEATGIWRIEAFFASRPDDGRLLADLAAAAAASGTGIPELSVVDLGSRDWVAENQRAFPPFRVGRFYIYGSCVKTPPPKGAHPILLDAATAFGTGEHETTRGCLLALDRLARRRKIRNPLDLGCGTGILAIAAARLSPVRVLASDIDPEAVRVAQANARANGVGARLRVVESVGFAHPEIVRNAPFDLIVANILARPLCVLARDMARRLAPGGVAVLSGLLTRQAAGVLAAHRQQGLRLAGRIALGDWPTLVLVAPRTEA